MSFIKLGELIEISRVENTESCIPQVSPEVLDNFRKIAANLKKIAPRAEDFLYFSAIMMHAAEAASLNDDGTIRLTASGKPVEVGWDKSGGTWKWTTNDPNIKPYKNSNGDIFPEDELVKAHKKWKDKPLCIDHKSNSVDHVRGFIVDTYYDRALKRVVALCALDKAGFPQLARQVSTGMSNCVSMGTAVGKAICTEAGCHRVAKMESDFCHHMKTKSGYGEINVDLNPLELSIVVNGADPKANIKNIIAAANTMNTYLENRAKVLERMAARYSATIIRSNEEPGSEISDTNSIHVQGSDLASFKEDIDRGIQQLESLNSKISEKDTNDLALNQSSGTVAMDETEVPNTDSVLAPPSVRYASTEAESITELRKIASAIEDKLSVMKQSLDKLAKNSKSTEEETMSGSKEMNKKGYYQGTEEPTPGQAKYPKDPLNEQLREHEDKQMVGQPPFPEVGPVDGMHPSPSSADPSNELERKKMLARAEAEERALRRNAIVNLAKQALEDKKAYIQGGGGVNEPTPGKVKYPKDKLNEELRNYEDKQMVGQKPFPGVGAVDGLHPSPGSAETSDELKRKEMLQRASLRARFVKASNADGSLNQAKSAWEVYLGEKLLLTASVKELSSGQIDKYGSIATREFGAQLIENVKFYGADKVRSLVKSAQAAPPPAAPPGPPADAAPPADAGAPPPADAPPGGEDAGGSGDPKESAVDLAEKARDVTSDLVEAVRALTGEQAEMGEAEAPAAPEMGAAASDETFSTANMGFLRRELNKELTHALKECIAQLNDHQEELDMIAGMYDKGSINNQNGEFVGSIVEDALTEAKAAIAKGFTLMSAFVKYARGTKAIVKRAEIEAELEALAEGDIMSTEHDSHSDSDLMSLINETNSDLDDVKDMMVDDNDHMGGDEGLEPHDESMEGDLDLEGLGLADDNDAGPTVEVAPGQKLPEGLGDDATVKVMASFDSKAGRAALRAKLAADATGKEDDGSITDMSKQKFSDMLDQADGLADGAIKLDVKPSDDLGRFETLPEINKQMLDLAKAPPKVRKEAEAIHKLVSEGKLDPADLDALVAEGLDKDAVSYYKKYFGEVEGGGEFANELVKEHAKAELEKELNTFKLKMARAYELTYDMVDRGLVANDRGVISAHVEELMSFNEANFETLKKVVAKHSPTMRKEAGRMPQVGMLGSGEVNSAAADDDWSQLSAAFSKTSKRMF